MIFAAVDLDSWRAFGNKRLTNCLRVCGSHCKSICLLQESHPIQARNELTGNSRASDTVISWGGRDLAWRMDRPTASV
jgi:hypothetical protein